MLGNSSPYSPDSEDNNTEEDQPLDFSNKKPKLSHHHHHHRKSSSSNSNKNHNNEILSLTRNDSTHETVQNYNRKSPSVNHSTHHNQLNSSATTTSTNNSSNYLTTPSPSPPEQHSNVNSNSNQVLCQLLTGNLIPTPTGKMIPGNPTGKIMTGNAMPSPILHHSSHYNNAEKIINNSNLIRSPSPPPLDRHLSINSPNTTPPIGLGPFNQIDMSSFNGNVNQTTAAAMERFVANSGGLLTTTGVNVGAVMNAFPDSKRSVNKYNRPFKAYPISALPTMGYYPIVPSTAEAIAIQSLNLAQADPEYLRFREQMKQEMNARKERQGTTSHKTKSPHSNTNGNDNGNLSINDNTIKQESLIHSSQNSSPQNSFQGIHNSNNETEPPQHFENHPSSPTIPTIPKTNGSASLSISTSQVNNRNSNISLDDNSQYSNDNSSGAEGESSTGSLSSSTVTGHTNSHSHSHSHSHSADNATSASGQSMRKRGKPLPDDLKDEAYWERRRKNNEAAKRSRDARRAKEDEIAIRAAFLEQENLRLRCETAQLKAEINKLKFGLYTN